jgi:protein-L-isoaspartate(D-aspartate) O-methyltransferase
MHANACESLLPFLKPGAKVLDIGSGSGYLTHVLAELVKPNGKVVGVDHLQPLVDMARRNMQKSEAGREMLESGKVQFVKADGRLGFERAAPYDAIHVGAAAVEHHEALERQLGSPGRYVVVCRWFWGYYLLTWDGYRMFVPVADSTGGQAVWVIDKDKHGVVTRKRLYGVMYVPLTDAYE